MNIIVCIDDDKGMLFNKRRVSRDSKVIEKIYDIVGSDKLWIAEFSKALFVENVIVDNQMLDRAGKGDFCFIENLELEPYIDRVEKLYVFNWNRSYPSDFKLDIEYRRLFIKEEEVELVGTSHEKVTLEVWRNK